MATKITLQGGLRTKGRPKRSLPEMPLITIVTVVYNGEAHLEQTILSVIDQTYRNLEYLIIDGGSTDGTLEIIKKYEDRIDYWLSESDRGIYDAMNKGIDLAHGELIGLLNADDFYEPHAIMTVADAHRRNPSRGIYYGNSTMIQDDLNLRYKRYPSMRYWLGMTLCHQAMFVHKFIYQTFGKYDDRYQYAADYEFFLRTATKNIPYYHIDEFLVNFRNTGTTSINYEESLHEGKGINKLYCGRFSINHGKYLLLYYKTITLFWAQKVIRVLCGDTILDILRSWYMKSFIIKDHQRL